jgi:hypothetical protein
MNKKMTKQPHAIDCTDETKWSSVGITDTTWFLWKIEYIDSALKIDGECIVTLPRTISNDNIRWLKIGISKEIDDFIDTYQIEYSETEKHFKITTRI